MLARMLVLDLKGERGVHLAGLAGLRMCIFMESELDVFQSAFTPATAASEPTAAATPSAAAPETKTAAEAADPEPA